MIDNVDGVEVAKETNNKIIICVIYCYLLVVGVGVKTIVVRVGATNE